MLTLRTLLSAACVALGCVPSLAESQAYAPIAVPQPPLTAADTVTRLALASALAAFSAPSKKPIIVSSRAGHLTSHALPDSAGLTFVLLSHADLQRFADDRGDFSYFEVYPVVFVGDTAKATIMLASAYSRPQHDGVVVHGGVTSCEWLVARGPRGWGSAGHRNCISLD